MSKASDDKAKADAAAQCSGPWSKKRCPHLGGLSPTHLKKYALRASQVWNHLPQGLVGVKINEYLSCHHLDFCCANIGGLGRLKIIHLRSKFE